MPLSTSLLSYWKYDEASGNPADSVGSNTLTNNNTVTYGTGLINNGGIFNGTNQYFSKAGGIGLDGTSAFSVSLWVKLAAEVPLNDVMGFVTQYDATTGSGTGWYIRYTDNVTQKALGTFFSIDGTAFANKSCNISALGTSVWHHIAVTFRVADSNAGITVYLDGTALSVTSANGSGTTYKANNNYVFGSLKYIPDGNYLNGRGDEVGIWQRELSAAEITSLYNGGAGLALASFPYPPANGNFFMFMPN